MFHIIGEVVLIDGHYNALKILYNIWSENQKLKPLQTAKINDALKHLNSFLCLWLNKVTLFLQHEMVRGMIIFSLKKKKKPQTNKIYQPSFCSSTMGISWSWVYKLCFSSCGILGFSEWDLKEKISLSQCVWQTPLPQDIPECVLNVPQSPKNPALPLLSPDPAQIGNLFNRWKLTWQVVIVAKR